MSIEVLDPTTNPDEFPFLEFSYYFDFIEYQFFLFVNSFTMVAPPKKNNTPPPNNTTLKRPP